MLICYKVISKEHMREARKIKGIMLNDVNDGFRSHSRNEARFAAIAKYYLMTTTDLSVVIEKQQ